MTDPVTSVQTGYDRWAAIYDHDGNPLQGLEEPVVRATVGDVRGLNVLDLGCGTGRHSLWLAAGGATVTAVDFSDGMLAEARKKPGADAVRFVAHDLHRPLPFPDVDRLMTVSLRMPNRASRSIVDMVWSYPKYVMFRDQQRAFDAIALHSVEALTTDGADGVERVPG